MQTQYLKYLTYRTLLTPVSDSGISEAEAKDILQQILPQLSALHDRDQTHGSISLDTVAYDYSRMEIVLLEGNGANHPTYLAPELVETQQATTTGDIYALGVALIVLLTGQPPEALKKSNNTWDWQEFCTVSDQFAKILSMAIFNEPDCRYFNAGQMLQSIQPMIHPSESTLTSLHRNNVTLLSPNTNPQDLSSKQPLPSVPLSDETRSLELLSSESNYGYRTKRFKVSFPNSKIHRKAKADNKTATVTTKGGIKILTAVFLVLGATISGAVGSYFYMQPKFADTTNKNLELAKAENQLIENQSIDEDFSFDSWLQTTSSQFLTQWQGSIQKNNGLISKIEQATRDEKWKVAISNFQGISETPAWQWQGQAVTGKSAPNLDSPDVVISSPSAASARLNVEPSRNLTIETYNPPAETFNPPVATYNPPAEVYNPPLVTYNLPAEEATPPLPPAPRVAN